MRRIFWFVCFICLLCIVDWSSVFVFVFDILNVFMLECLLWLFFWFIRTSAFKIRLKENGVDNLFDIFVMWGLRCIRWWIGICWWFLLEMMVERSLVILVEFLLCLNEVFTFVMEMVTRFIFVYLSVLWRVLILIGFLSCVLVLCSL